MVETLFWISVAGIAYTYLGYPAILWLWGRLRPRPVRKGPYLPTVSLVIVAHNEAAAIRQKLEGCLKLNYPPDRLEILVGTDGCTDQTDAVIAKIASPIVHHHRFRDRMGKATILNSLVPLAQGEILVFTDARQTIEPESVKRLVENFRDPTVGAVSGELMLLNEDQSPVAEGIGAYWRYEKFIRRQESQIGSTIGATGAFYAIRRRLYRPLNSQTVLDDVSIPLNIVRQGYRTVFESSALAYDHVARSGQEEFRRKVRTLAGNYQLFLQHAALLNLTSPIAWQFWSHKVLRTVVPLWLVIAFLSSVWLGGLFYRTVGMIQAVFYTLAIIGWLGQRRRWKRLQWKLTRMAYVFCLFHVSAVVGFYRFLRGAQPVVWEKANA